MVGLAFHIITVGGFRLQEFNNYELRVCFERIKIRTAHMHYAIRKTRYACAIMQLLNTQFAFNPRNAIL